MTQNSTPHEDILKRVNAYYTDKVTTHGPVHRGVDWNSTESQHLRFDQVLKVCTGDTPFSLNDYGCGYGALALYLREKKAAFTYNGFDISEAMIAQAKQLLIDDPACIFYSAPDRLTLADYTVASGIFNVKMQVEVEHWKNYIEDTIATLAAHSTRGFAFNMLTAYSDADRMRPDLYYGDPLYYFDLCRRKYSRNVALLHDYNLYEFTLIVRLGQS
jgi:SAM-dependent methyltransferase